MHENYDCTMLDLLIFLFLYMEVGFLPMCPTWPSSAGLAFLLRLDEQGVSFRLPMPDNDLICSLILTQFLRTCPMNTSGLPTFELLARVSVFVA